MKFSYQSEKFSSARRCLMLPHPKGEAYSIHQAFIECSNGLDDLSLDDLDDSARSWVLKLKEFMNTDNLDDPHSRGLFLIKAEQLNESQLFDLTNIVDELAHWFDMNFWTDK